VIISSITKIQEENHLTISHTSFFKNLFNSEILPSLKINWSSSSVFKSRLMPSPEGRSDQLSLAAVMALWKASDLKLLMPAGTVMKKMVWRLRHKEAPQTLFFLWPSCVQCFISLSSSHIQFSNGSLLTAVPFFNIAAFPSLSCVSHKPVLIPPSLGLFCTENSAALYGTDPALA